MRGPCGARGGTPARSTLRQIRRIGNDKSHFPEKRSALDCRLVTVVVTCLQGVAHAHRHPCPPHRAKRCGVLIHLDHGPALFVERTGDELPALIDRCFASASRAVRKRVQQESLQRFLPRHEAAAVLAAQESGR